MGLGGGRHVILLLGALVVLLCPALSGCGPGVEEGPLRKPVIATPDASMDAGPTETGRRDAGNVFEVTPYDDAGAVVVFPPGYHCEDVFPDMWTIISAEDVGEGAHLVAMGQSTLLAEQEVDGVTQPVLVFLDPAMYGSGEARLAVPSQEPLHGIGVVNRRDAPMGEGWLFQHHAIALVSGPEGNRLYGASPEPDGMAELVLLDEPSLLPAGAELRGLTYLQDKVVENAESLSGESALQQVCALGDGIFCFSYDGVSYAASTLVESGSGPSFNSMTVLEREGSWIAVAVGDEGRITEIPLGGGGAPVEIDSGLSGRLIGVSAYDGRLAISGEKGLVAYYETFPAEPDICNLFPQTIVSLKWWGPELRGITADGGIFGLPFQGCDPCFFGISLGSALQGRVSGLDGDLLVLNAQGLYRVTGKFETVVIE